MKKYVLILLLSMAVSSQIACETSEGIGEDVEKAGEEIKEAAEEVEQEI